MDAATPAMTLHVLATMPVAAKAIQNAIRVAQINTIIALVTRMILVVVTTRVLMSAIPTAPTMIQNFAKKIMG